MFQSKTIQIIKAPSILGLKPNGVEKLPDALLSNRLVEKLNHTNPLINVPTLNHLYSDQRDAHTALLNGPQLNEFSQILHREIKKVVQANKFALVLGGDCSILIGIMSALKLSGSYGLFFVDAHADFYEPEKSITGQAADMDLALVTGRGPEIVSNIYNAAPYVLDDHVIQIGQRDMEEAKKFDSQDIRSTDIKCFDFPFVQQFGVPRTMALISEYVNSIKTDGFWIHFDTDVLSDEDNPAVEYRLPGGLSFEQCESILKELINTYHIIGMSVTIFNPTFDKKGEIAKRLSACIANIMN
jgi:arginase